MVGQQHQTVSGLPDRQDDHHRGGDNAPDDGNDDPEGEVPLGEDPGREGQAWPDEDEYQREHRAVNAHAPESDAETLPGVLALVGQLVSAVLVDDSDGGVQSGEVVVLGLDEGDHDADETGRQDRHEVASKHGEIVAQAGDGHLAGLG
eukprot:scaffold621769_cov38-Prasinocladus_malaysianus.AAC.1